MERKIADMVVDEQNGLKYLTVSFTVLKKVRQLKKKKKKMNELLWKFDSG